MTRARLFVGAVLLTGMVIWAHGASPAAMTAGGFLASGGFPFAVAVDGGFDDLLTGGDWFRTAALATGIFGADLGAFFGGPSVDDIDPTEIQRTAAFSLLGPASASVGDVDDEPRGSLPGSTVIDVTRLLSPPEDFQTVSRGIWLTRSRIWPRRRPRPPMQPHRRRLTTIS